MDKMRRANSWSESKSVAIACDNDACEAPTKYEFTATEFHRWLGESSDNDFVCSNCGHEMSTYGLKLICHICEAEIAFDSLSQIPLILDDRCSNCAARHEWDVSFHSVVVEGSLSADWSIYDWSMEQKKIDPLKRLNRTDYWEGLVHFCERDQFASIYRDRRISASSTGYFYKCDAGLSRAVCLTEATQPNWNDLTQTHGTFGFIFRKRDIIAISGAPAIYLPQSVFDAMKKKNERVPKTLWPYVNKLFLPDDGGRGRIDFLHEREWRVPMDIDLDQAKPFAITLPADRQTFRNQREFLSAAIEFGEISNER